MSYLSPELSVDDINDFFNITKKPTVACMPAARSTIGGRPIDPNTGGSAANRIERCAVPSYKKYILQQHIIFQTYYARSIYL